MLEFPDSATGQTKTVIVGGKTQADAEKVLVKIREAVVKGELDQQIENARQKARRKADS